LTEWGGKSIIIKGVLQKLVNGKRERRGDDFRKKFKGLLNCQK